MSEEQRPAWRCCTDEETARWLLEHTVTKISHQWKFTSEDTSMSWLELHDKYGVATRSVSLNFFEANIHEVSFLPDHSGLVCVHEPIRRNIEAIDKWENKNSRDRREYERLKRKFG